MNCEYMHYKDYLENISLTLTILKCDSKLHNYDKVLLYYLSIYEHIKMELTQDSIGQVQALIGQISEGEKIFDNFIFSKTKSSLEIETILKVLKDCKLNDLEKSTNSPLFDDLD